MTMRIDHIRPTVDGHAYQVLIEVGGEPMLFVLRVERTPVFRIAAPSSFWSTCDEHDLDSRLILDLVRRADAGEELVWPLVVSNASSESVGAESKLWGANAGCRLPAESLRRSAECFLSRTDATLFPKSFEYGLIHENWEDLGRAASQVDLLRHSVANYRQVTAPKSSGGTRTATQLDPLDNLLLTASVFELGPVFEAARVSPDEHVVHSYRFAGKATELWDRGFDYGTFLARANELTNEGTTRFVVETDISSFYHRVPVDVAVNSLERAGGSLKLLEGVRRVWLSFSKLGLPVGPVPSAFFAEAVLSEVDNALLASGASFVRYSDDYRFFCKTELEARTRLQLLSELLYRKAALSLQDAKTRITEVDAYRKHLETKDAWLGDLREHVLAQDPKYGDPPAASLDAENQKRLASAHKVFSKALSSTHPAWVRLCRLALAAMPLSERLDQLPMLLAQLGRLKAIAPQLSRSMGQYAMRRPGQRDDLVLDAVHGIEQDEGLDGPDFGRLWVVHSFARKDWSSLDALLRVHQRWPNDTATRRHLVLALRNEPDLASKIETDPTDGWQRRAALRVFGRAKLGAYREDSERERWNALLDAVIAESSPHDEFSEH